MSNECFISVLVTSSPEKAEFEHRYPFNLNRLHVSRCGRWTANPARSRSASALTVYVRKGAVRLAQIIRRCTIDFSHPMRKIVRGGAESAPEGGLQRGGATRAVAPADSRTATRLRVGVGDQREPGAPCDM